MIPRLLLSIVLVVAKPVINGILWAVGAALGEALVRSRIKEGIAMLARTRLLFHPKITMTAGLVGLASFCTLIASVATPLHKVAIVGPYADTIVGTAMVIGPIALWVATYGRSPASAVDNNKPPA